MQTQKKRTTKRLAGRALQERLKGEIRQQRGMEIRASFERRREWFVGLIVAFLLLPVLLTFAPKEAWGSWAFLIATVFLVRVAPLIVRYTVWRCPNCNKALPISTRFGPFERRKEDCPYCGVRLE